MSTYKRSDKPTPHGGAYSEIYYLDRNGNEVDESVAFQAIIKECKENGDVINETLLLRR